MMKNSGIIVNVNSGGGEAGFENLSAYCASLVLWGWPKVWH